MNKANLALCAITSLVLSLAGCASSGEKASGEQEDNYMTSGRVIAPDVRLEVARSQMTNCVNNHPTDCNQATCAQAAQVVATGHPGPVSGGPHTGAYLADGLHPASDIQVDQAMNAMIIHRLVGRAELERAELKAQLILKRMQMVDSVAPGH